VVFAGGAVRIPKHRWKAVRYMNEEKLQKIRVVAKDIFSSQG
jgi:hypothetical protein